MERETKPLNGEEIISGILGLPIERIIFLKEEHGMPTTYPDFSEWFVNHPDIVLDEMKANFEQSIFPREFRPETPEPSSGPSF
jgi:hypothetical protein